MAGGCGLPAVLVRGAAPAPIHAPCRADEALTRFDHLIRITDRLAKIEAGSAAADDTIHAAVGQAGPAPAYSTNEAAARTLLPPGFEWMPATPAAGGVYAPCRRAGLDTGRLSYPHHGQWGRTLPLSLCGSAMRAWAMLAKG